MAGSSGDSITRRSVASQFFTQEEGPGIDGMTTSERVSTERRAWNGEPQPLSRGSPPPGDGAQGVPTGLGWPGWHRHLPLPSVQVVDLLNQAALITNDSKITVLKQVRG